MLTKLGFDVDMLCMQYLCVYGVIFTKEELRV